MASQPLSVAIQTPECSSPVNVVGGQTTPEAPQEAAGSPRAPQGDLATAGCFMEVHEAGMAADIDPLVDTCEFLGTR